MNYQLHYSKLIEKAQNRKILEYSERHHIIPKCMGGDNKKENLVRLTPEEHFLAHQLLVKMYTGNYKLVLSVKMMTVSGGKVVRNNKMFGWLRRLYSEAMKINGNPPNHTGRIQTPKHISKRVKSRAGYIMPESLKLQISKSNMGKSGTRNGVKLTEIEKNLLRDISLNLPKTECEHCGKSSSPGNYKRWHGNNCRKQYD